MKFWSWIGNVCAILSFVVSAGIVAYMYYNGGNFSIQSISFGDASITTLCAITAISLGWNIYRVLEDKEKIKKEILEEVDKELAKSKYEFYHSFITEEITLANIYMESEDWNKTLSFLSLMGKRYELIAKNYNKDIDISTYIEVIKTFIEKIDGEFIHNNNLYGFIKGVFYPLAKYDDSILDVYKSYKDKVGRTPKTQPEFMKANTTEVI